MKTKTRRQALSALGSGMLAVPLVPLLAASLPTPAQQRRIARVGILLLNSPQIDYIVPLLDGLKALGYVEGQNIRFDYRFAEGQADRLPELAAELVRLQPET